LRGPKRLRTCGLPERGGLRIPLLSKSSASCAGPKADHRDRNRLKAGRLHQVSLKRVTAQVLQCWRRDPPLFGQQELFTVIEAKIHLDLGRDLTIEILEYFDSIKFTRRQGNGRLVMDAESPGRLLM
jgi:hypothetical protein